MDTPDSPVYTTGSTSSTNPHTASPLMATLSRLSHATSRPDLPPQSSYATKTLRAVSSGGKEVFRRAGLATLWPESAAPPQPKIRQTIDTSRILYPTLASHPAPHPCPILVLSLSALGSYPADATNDELFSVLLSRLEPWVGEEGEGGYVLIVLAAEGEQKRNMPGVGWWVWKWKRLARRYRKNLKRLYIIHPSPLTRTLLPILSPFLSPKSFSKLHTLPSLLSLGAYSVPLTGIELSLADLSEEARTSRAHPAISPLNPTWGSTISSTLGTMSSYLPIPRFSDEPILRKERSGGYFGRTADEVIEESSGEIPKLLKDLRRVILEESAEVEGVFRRGSNSELLRPIADLLSLAKEDQPILPWKAIATLDPLLPPTMLKRWLRSTKDPIIPQTLYGIVRETTGIESVRENFVAALGNSEALILGYIISESLPRPLGDSILTTYQICRSPLDLFLILNNTLTNANRFHDLLPFVESTKMTATNFAIILSPCLINSDDALQDAEMCLEVGKSLPAGMRKLGGPEKKTGRGGTLVGLLDTWIIEGGIGGPKGLAPKKHDLLGGVKRT
ncbi:hypothetical protein P7C73_g4952, partial [Tremellales sp. Uapishka_1]